MSELVEQKRFVKSYAGKNNNKYWYISLFTDGSVRTEWGRIGVERGQSKTFPYSGIDAGRNQFNKKIQSKLKGKKDEPPYQEVEVVETQGVTHVSGTSQSLESIVLSQLSDGTDVIIKLLQYLLQENRHSILSTTTMTYSDTSGLFSTPVGVVSRDTVSKARDLLNTILDDIAQNDVGNNKHVQHIEQYLMYIPQKIKDMRTVSDLFQSQEQIIAQNNILDSLDSSLDIVESSSGQQPQQQDSPGVTLGSSIHMCDDKHQFKHIRDFFVKTINDRHTSKDLRLKVVYNIDIQKMSIPYQQYTHLGNIMELWHGTKVANVLSILCSGFSMAPPSTVRITGKMYGPGLYFSDQSTKSLNYSDGYWGGGGRSSRVFMFLNDVVMGKMYKPRSSGSTMPSGYHSIFAEAGKSGVYNNEMIVRQTGQINPTYLCEFG